MKNRILRVVFDTDLRCSHDGLAELLKDKFSFDVDTLALGEYVVFVNSAKTIVKIFASRHVLAHYKSPRGQIDLRTLQHIPECFNGTAFKYDKALAKVLAKEIRA